MKIFFLIQTKHNSCLFSSTFYEKEKVNIIHFSNDSEMCILMVLQLSSYPFHEKIIFNIPKLT
jgi:hypothetical protein